jgi:hypothetical protein
MAYSVNPSGIPTLCHCLDTGPVRSTTLEPREADLSGRALGSASGLSPSPRQVPDLAGEARCQGSARSEAQGREGPRPERPNGSFRGDRIARRGEDGRPLWQARSLGCVTAGPPGGGCGGTALRRRPAPCVPTLRQRAWAAAHQRRDSLLTPAPPTAGTPACPTLSGEPCAHAWSTARAGRAGAPKACP